MMSFIRKPPKGLVGDRAPGVVTRNDSVTRKVPAAITLPRADRAGRQRRSVISSAAASSTTPMRAEVPRTPNSGYSQLSSGLFSTSGRMPSASKAANLKPPHNTSRATRP